MIQTPISKRPTATKQENTEKYTLIRGEIALWSAVLLQALVDASTTSTKAEAQKHRREAISFLSNYSVRFQIICRNAFRDPRLTHLQCQQALERIVQWRGVEEQNWRTELKKKLAEQTDAITKAYHDSIQ